MIDTQHLDAVVEHTIRHDIRRPRHHEFARTGNPASATHIRLLSQQFLDTVKDAQRNALCRLWIFFRDIGTQCRQIVDRLRRPYNNHLRRRGADRSFRVPQERTHFST